MATLEKTIASVMMALIVLLVFVAAASRYLGQPINWSVDVAQGLFVWVIFLGASRAMRQNRHIGISFVVDALPPAIRKAIGFVVDAVVAVFLCGVAWYGVQISIVNVNRQMTGLTVSYSFVTIAISVGCLLMLVTVLTRLVAALRRSDAE